MITILVIAAMLALFIAALMAICIAAVTPGEFTTFGGLLTTISIIYVLFCIFAAIGGIIAWIL